MRVRTHPTRYSKNSVTKTYAYTYDTAGNLLTESVDGTVTKTYTYGNDQWNDLLTEFNGGKIAYEGQTYSERPELVNSEPVVTGTPVSGNPISYYNGSRWTLEWQHGRNLTRSLYVGSNKAVISEEKVDVENDLKTIFSRQKTSAQTVNT